MLWAVSRLYDVDMGKHNPCYDAGIRIKTGIKVINNATKHTAEII
jgi:hypothetical protein